MTQAPLKIAVVGAGNIGSAFAYQLARAGNDVTAVARPGSKRLEQLRRDGGVVLTTGDRAEMHVTDTLDESAAYDLVIVTTLAHQVDSVLPALQRSNAACVHFMFVNFEPERLRDAIGAERCTFGMPFVMALIDAAGKLKLTINSRQKTLHGDERWAELFTNAGISSAFEADMPLWLRCHAPMSIAFESISVFGESRGGGATWGESMAVARGLRAGFSIVEALGYRLYPTAKARINALPIVVTASMLFAISRVASFRKLLATGRYECRALIEAMTAAAAAKANLANAAAVTALAAIKPSA